VDRHAPPAGPPLTLAEAAAYLNVTERFMRRLVAERRIAFHKVGHLLRFRATDLEAFLEAGRVEPPPEHPLLRRSPVAARPSRRGGGRR
jgi:excisionase family DNA binding protein